MKDRQATYGHPGSVYTTWAHLIQPILIRMLLEDRTLATSSECAMMLVLLKAAREVNAGYPADYRDNVDDLAGYANVLHMTKEAPHGS